MPNAAKCLSCKKRLKPKGYGRPPKYCNDRCKHRELRRLRKAWERVGRIATKRAEKVRV